MYSPELELNGQILVKMFKIQKNILEHLKKQYFMLFSNFVNFVHDFENVY